MSDTQTQCWICPQCHDDKHHLPDDERCLRNQIASLKLDRAAGMEPVCGDTDYSEEFKSAWVNGLPLDGSEARWAWQGWKGAQQAGIDEQACAAQSAESDTQGALSGVDAAQGSGEAVYQFRPDGNDEDEWIDCNERDLAIYRQDGRWPTRTLYTHPSSSIPAREQIKSACTNF